MPESLARAVAAEIARRRRAKIGHEDRCGRATAPGRVWPPVLTETPPLLATSGLTASAAPRFVLP